MLNRFRQWLRPAPSDTGANAERQVADWLRRERRFRILAANWRNPRDEREEIDLVCDDGGVLVFVEVKARTEWALVPGYFAVDRRKKRAMERACRAYLRRLQPKPNTFRFDVVEVAVPTDAREPSVVRHFENVPLFTKRFRG